MRFIRSVFDDPVTLLAALAGGLAGVVIMLRLGWWRASSAESPPLVEPTRARPTGYVSRHGPSAFPILSALGGAAIGIGLAIGSAGGRLDLLPLLPGFVLLTAGLLSLHRRSPHDVADTEVEGREPADLAPR
ncbi:MAG: hypothetical protein ABIO99_09195 [Candidatus Limnocylindria bacterium]